MVRCALLATAESRRTRKQSAATGLLFSRKRLDRVDAQPQTSGPDQSCNQPLPARPRPLIPPSLSAKGGAKPSTPYVIKVRWSAVWSRFVWSERGDWLPFACRFSPPLDAPFDREKYPVLARAVDDWLDGSGLRKS